MTHARMLLRRAALAAFFIASAAPAFAQSFTGAAPSGRVFANAGASPAPGSWVTATAWFDRAFCAINNTVPVRQGGSWNCASVGAVIQAWDADLDAIAALSGTGFAVRTGANTWAQRTVTGTANEVAVANGDGVSGNPTFSLPPALTFTGKTVTGGTFFSPTIDTPAISTPTVSGGTIDNTAIGATTPSAVKATSTNATQRALWSGQTSPAQITADQNNYTATDSVDGTASCANRIVLRLITDANRTVTGLSCGQSLGDRKAIVNDGSFDVILSNENASSMPTNRFSLSSSLTVAPKEAVTLIHDGSRWRALGGSGSAGGGGGAPIDATYIVQSADGSLTNERSLTNTSTVTWDFATAGQAKADVPNDAITNAKLANMANSTIKCRSTAGTGDPEDCSIANVLNMAGSTQGMILYRNASVWTVLGPGTAGQALATGGAGANPAWETQGSRFISTQTAATSGALQFTGLGACNVYQFEITNLIPATANVALIMEVGTGAGPTWQTSGYAYAYAQTNTASGTSALTNGGASNILLTRTGSDGVSNTADRAVSGTIKAYGLSQGVYKRFTVETGWRSSGFMATFPGAAEWQSGTAVTAVRFRMDSGNIASGTVSMFCLGQ